MARRKTIILSIILIFGVLLYLLTSWQINKLPQKSSTSVYGKHSNGLQLFHQLAEKAKPNSVLINRSSLWKKNSLPQSSVLFILAPKKKLSPRVLKVVSDFVKSGGQLVISFQEKNSWQQLEPLIKNLEGPKSIKEDLDFKNGQVKVLSPPQNLAWFLKNEKYAFYSRLKIAGEACKADPFACYLQQWKHQKGQVTLIAGLPILTNALLQRQDNRQVAFRFIASGNTLWFDEYHHFYSEHRLGQLLLKPSFGLPLLGMMLCVWLFFLLGHNRFGEKELQRELEKKSKSFHQTNESILAKKLTSTANFETALQMHQSFLEKIFPYAKKEIAAMETELAQQNRQQFLKRAQDFIRLHQNLIAKKRRFLKKSQK